MAMRTSDRPVRISPAFQRLGPPLIVVGMHRSGTSLVSGMLSLLGVQMYPHALPKDETGRIVLPTANERMNGYAEAEPFYLMNERILGRAQATWDFVDPFLKVRDEPKFEQASVEPGMPARMQGTETSHVPRGIEIIPVVVANEPGAA